MLREMEDADIPQVAKIHKTALPNDFLPSLGEEFLTTLYKANLKSKNSGVIVYQEKGKILGFVMGTVNFKKFFLLTLFSNWLKFLFIITKRLITQPEIGRKVLETLFYSKREKVNVNAELVVIAVDNSTQGKGIGTKLVKALENKFKKLGIKQYKVATLKSYEGANRFYQKLGFKIASQFFLYDKKWNLYLKEL